MMGIIMKDVNIHMKDMTTKDIIMMDMITKGMITKGIVMKDIVMKDIIMMGMTTATARKLLPPPIATKSSCHPPRLRQPELNRALSSRAPSIK